MSVSLCLSRNARTFSMALGQSLAMILFSSIATFGGTGYRVTALVATAFCLLGGLVFLRYHEGDVLKVVTAHTEALLGGSSAERTDDPSLIEE